jgi:hypothetical protein
MLIAGSQFHRFKNHNQQGQAHGQLRKQIVERDCERELEPMNIQSGFHFTPRAKEMTPGL